MDDKLAVVTSEVGATFINRHVLDIVRAPKPARPP